MSSLTPNAPPTQLVAPDSKVAGGVVAEDQLNPSPTNKDHTKIAPIPAPLNDDSEGNKSKTPPGGTAKEVSASTSLTAPVIAREENAGKEDDGDKKPQATSRAKKLQPPKKPFRYVAVRSCDGLQAPAIFLSFEDSEFYIDVEENDTPAQYEEFADLDDAKDYIQNFIGGGKAKTRKSTTAAATTGRNNKKRSAAAAAIDIGTNSPRQARSRKARKTSKSSSAAKAKSSRPKKKPTAAQQDWLDGFEDMVKLAQEYKGKHGDCNIPLQDAMSGGKLGAWCQKARLFAQQYQNSDGESSFLSDNHFDTLVEFGIVKTVEERQLEQKTERRERKLEKQKKDLNDTWDAMIRQIQEFRAETGAEQMPLSAQGDMREKYGDLFKWLQKIRKYMKEYTDESPTSSPISEEQIADLTGLGVIASRGDKDKKLFSGEMWPDMIKELKRFKQAHGHCEVPLKRNNEEYLQLSQWVTRLKAQMKNFEQNPESSHLDEAKMAELKSMGFSSKYKRGFKGKSPHEEKEEFEKMLVSLRQINDAKQPINKNLKLQAWIAKQRKEYDAFKNNQKSTMDIDRITRLTNAGFVFDAKPTLSWEERALNWFQYKTKHGTDPKRYSEDGLGKWVTEQRSKYNRKKAGVKTNLSEDQIAKLSAWGFSWEPKIKQPTSKAARASWDDRFKQLVQWKEEHGHCIVPQHYPVLGQWVHGQRSEYRKFQKGLKSPMTDEKIQRLESIGFIFYTGRGGGVRTPESVARRLNQTTDLEPDPFTHMLTYYNTGR